MNGRFLTDEPCRVVRCLIKKEVETDKQLERIFSHLNRFLLENKFKISFSNVCVHIFSKKLQENDKWKNFLKRASLVTIRTATQRATLLSELHGNVELAFGWAWLARRVFQHPVMPNCTWLCLDQSQSRIAVGHMTINVCTSCHIYDIHVAVYRYCWACADGRHPAVIQCWDE